MAAVTPTSVDKAILGSYNAYMVKFDGTLDTGDTWASGIPGIVFWIATQADGNTTQASAGVGATVSGSTFTFAVGEDNTAVHLFVIGKG
jgi:hypothetical protein